ncbi:MAG TPA: hypothetical protein VGJ87_04360, partial [Roseiflexaceae bacterium]
DSIFPGRPAFFEGQRLTAADLTAAQDYLRELRRLHNRSLHGWGIVAGLSVTGEKGSRDVTIAPGYAIDAGGREILVATEQTLPVPPVAGSSTGGEAAYFLTVAYVDDADLAPADTRSGGCLEVGTVRLIEEARFAWRVPGTEQTGYEIVLAEVQVRQCCLSRLPSGAERRSIPTRRAGVASGIARGLAWRFWGSDDATIILGVAADVDTAPARFVYTPRYVAQVQGSRLLTLSGDHGTVSPIVDGFVSVADPTPSGFVLRMLLAPRDALLGEVTLNPESVFGPEQRDLFLRTVGDAFDVVWMGIED